MEIGILAAFLGGALALLSPCGALLLPAYFASQASGALRLVVHGALFYLGLAAVLVPLGMGAGALGSTLATHRDAVIAVTSAVLIVLGVVHALGWGLDLTRLLPGRRSQPRPGAPTGGAASRARGAGSVRALLLGAAGGVAGFCAGPILGAVLTLAAAQGDVMGAGLLMAMYAAGMVVPLVAIAAGWERLGRGGRRRLRGREFTALGRRWHSTSLITGALMVALGVMFWATNGLVTVPSLLGADAQATLQAQITTLPRPAADVGLVIVAALVALAAWHVHRRRRERAERSEAQHRPAGGDGS